METSYGALAQKVGLERRGVADDSRPCSRNGPTQRGEFARIEPRRHRADRPTDSLRRAASLVAFLATRAGQPPAAASCSGKKVEHPGCA